MEKDELKWYVDSKGDKHQLTQTSIDALGGLKASGLHETTAPDEAKEESKATETVAAKTAKTETTETEPAKVTRRRGPNKPKETGPTPADEVPDISQTQESVNPGQPATPNDAQPNGEESQPDAVDLADVNSPTDGKATGK